MALEGQRQPELLLGELDWLSSLQQGHAYHFGFELGLFDLEETWLQPLLAAYEKTARRTLLLFSGYLRALQDRDVERWENLMDGWAQDSGHQILIGELTFRAGLTSRSAQRLLRLAEAGQIEVGVLATFLYSAEVGNLAPAIINRWIDLLADSMDRTHQAAALSLISTVYIRQKERKHLLVRLTMKVLKLVLQFEGRLDTMTDYTWGQVAEALGNQNPRTTLTLARHLLTKASMAVWKQIGHGKAVEVLTRAAERFPDELWPTVVAGLAGSSERQFHLTQWLHGDAFTFGDHDAFAAITLFDPQQLWDWVDVDVDKRAWRAALLVPPTFDHQPGTPNLTRTLLIRYGDRDDVRRNLAANFGTGGWTGNASDHSRIRAKRLRHQLDGETEPRVRSWIDMMIGSLTKQEQSERMMEEREL